MAQSPPTASVNRVRGRLSRRSGSPGLQPYDFHRPIKLAREHIRLLQIAFETFARGFGTLLNTRLRAQCQVSLLAIEQLTIEEYIASLSNPTMIAQTPCAQPCGKFAAVARTTSCAAFAGMALVRAEVSGKRFEIGGREPSRNEPAVEVQHIRRHVALP